MKKICVQILTILAGISLVSCADVSNQNMGTATGAVVGGLLGSQFGQGGGQLLAVGLGAVAGGLIGGAVGRNMDENDRARMNQALENNPEGQPAYWVNQRSGTRYTVIPVRNVTVHHNRYCREYRTVANIAGKQQQVYGTACRQPDGTWKIVK